MIPTLVFAWAKVEEWFGLVVVGGVNVNEKGNPCEEFRNKIL